MTDTGTDQRISHLEAELAAARAEINRLELQLSVFTSTDPLTGLSNRNGILDALQGAIDRQHRMTEPYCVVMLRFPQLDDLKASLVEDDLEEALRHLGAIVAAGLRTVDSVGRIDDTTFVAVLTNCPGEFVDVVINRSLESIRALPLSAGASEFVLDPVVVALMSGPEPAGGAELVLAQGCDVLDSSSAGDGVVIAL